MGAQQEDPAAGLNEAIVIGQFVAEAEHRELPSGSVAASFSLTVRRPGEKTTSVPMCWFDPPARLETWKVGDIVVARGQVVRRFYRAGAALGSATEVVVTQAELSRHSKKAERLISQAQHELTNAVGLLQAS